MPGKKNVSGLGRTRNFATIVYPESAPDNWLSILDDQHVPAFVSPLHDRDLDPNGEPKKPHWHVLIMFENVKTIGQAKELFDLIGGVGCQKVSSIRGNARYLCHMDNPEKAQYDPQGVRAFVGADYIEICSLVSDKYAAIKDIIEFCECNGIINFADLLVYCSENRFDWFRILCDSGAFVLKEYMKSRNWGKTCNASKIHKNTF